MSWSWTLYRYLALQFLAGVGMVYGGFLTLAFAIGEIGRASCRERVCSTV